MHRVFGNFLNRHDATRLLEKVFRGDATSLGRKVFRTSRRRTEAAWRDPDASESQWWAIERVRRRWANFVTGSPNLAFPEYVAARYLADRRGLIGLSPGCGSGYHLLRWAELGIFARLDAFDLVRERVAAAQHEANARGFGDVVRCRVGSMVTFALPPRSYDVVLAEHVLHHFSPLRSTLTRLAGALSPNGLLYADEFVGPTRFQWTSRQLEAANALLALLPARYRVGEDGRPKRQVIRPSHVRMMITDPSEAVESSCIMPLLRELFDVSEERGYGGSILHLTLAGIAHNFVADDEETRQVLEMCFAVEDALLRAGDVASDFVVAVCRPRT